MQLVLRTSGDTRKMHNEVIAIRPAISFVKDKFKEAELVGAEVGVAWGSHARSILSNVDMKELILIDPWEKYELKDQSIDPSNFYEETVERFKNDNNVKILREFSTKAVLRFSDEYFDFVYIDACHTYEDVVQDLSVWWPKIKSGGVLCGHDFSEEWPGIVRAVTEFCGRNSLKLNSRFSEPNTRSDWWTVKE